LHGGINRDRAKEGRSIQVLDDVCQVDTRDLTLKGSENKTSVRDLGLDEEIKVGEFQEIRIPGT